MREKIAFKSSVIGLFSRVSKILLAFICTRVFMQNIGAEIKGLNGVLASCVGMLQLAELGIGSAIVYALYQPIVEKNIKEIQLLMNFYKRAYRVIGIIILVLGIGMSFCLDFFIEESTLPRYYIVCAFYMHLIVSVCSYFLSYRSNLLYADQKQYIAIMVDSVINVVVSIGQIWVIVYYKSYMLYLVLLIIHKIGANLYIYIWCGRQYPYLKEKVIEKYDKTYQLIRNVKDLFISRLGGYVYSATDQLVLSKIVGLISVGYMSNYYQISKSLNMIASSISEPIQPMLGNYIRQYKDSQKTFKIFLSYTFIRYCIANVITVGMIVMSGPMIDLWVGKENELSIVIPILLGIDIFISLVHGPTVEMIAVLGLFRNDRNMSLIGAVINLGTSILFSYRFGVSGVVIGTCIAQIYYWTARAGIVFREYFKEGQKHYIIKVMGYSLATAIEAVAAYYLRTIVIRETTLFTFLIMCSICVVLCMLCTVIFFGCTEEFKYMFQMVQNNLRRRKK